MGAGSSPSGIDQPIAVQGSRFSEGRRSRRRPSSFPGHLALGAVYAWRMCRNIRTLYNFDPPATSDEVHAAALQYVRKISGFNKPSRANEEAFDLAVGRVAAASMELLSQLKTTAPPRDREVEAAKARARAAERFAA